MTDRKHPDYDNEPIPEGRKIGELYDEAAAIGTMHAIFPREQIDTIHALTGIPVRSITRHLRGQQRVPPSLLEKYRKQNRLKQAFLADLADLLERHSEAGLLHEVMRQTLLTEVNSDFFKNDESL